LPLVGPSNLPDLADAYEWEVEPNLRNIPVRFSDVIANHRAIGAYDVEPPSGGSHYILKLPGARRWPVDKNHEQVQARFLRQLVLITGLPLLVVKYALINGHLPAKRLRLTRVPESLM
jgi:hypothetical protein